MKKTILNGEEQKVTALQLWNEILTAELQRIMMIENTSRLKRSKQMIYFAEQFEVTKHRIIVDRIIKELENCDVTIDGYTGHLKSIVWWRMRKRRELRGMIQTFTERRFAYKEALLILVNTEPPAAPAAAGLKAVKANPD